MIRLSIAVEGQTEEEFVKAMVATHLSQHGIESQPIQLYGAVSVSKLVKEMSDLARSFDFVTSLVDFYGLRGKDVLTCEELEKKMRNGLSEKLQRQNRIFPYVQKHEFESLLFADTKAFSVINGTPKNAMTKLQRIRKTCPGGPEDINDDENTAPSKRIQRVIPRYNKIADGIRIAKRIGIKDIRDVCPRFNAWLAKMESLRQ